MAHSIDIVKDANYVRLSLNGELSIEDHETARADIAHALTENGWDKLLIDAVHVETKMSALDHFDFTVDHPLHLPVNLRTAIIHHPDATERFRFIENVARNRGMRLRIFTEHVQARDWLLEEHQVS